MAQIFPFQPLRYSAKAGPLSSLVTQPYDKISPSMQARYLSLSPYNLVRVILGERSSSDHDGNNVYTRATALLNDWIADGILEREAEPGLYAYFQEFANPDTGEQLVRKGFIGLGAVTDYSEGVVHRHEQTLSRPKKDRLELLRHTHAHFGQIFVTYPDPAGEIDSLLALSAAEPPTAEIVDEYGAAHRLWRIGGASVIAQIRALMADKKLLIADGHHRYETALAFRNENPGLAGADKVMMTFVNMHSPGLKILATHRLVNGLENFDENEFLRVAATEFRVEKIGSLAALEHAWESEPVKTIIGAAIGDRLYLLESRDVERQLAVRVLHGVLLKQILGIGEEAVREQTHLHYIRGLDGAAAEARRGEAQIAFLLKPASMEEVAEIAFAGGVMPQKSTDFYPKLLSGLTIYRM